MFFRKIPHETSNNQANNALGFFAKTFELVQKATDLLFVP